MALHRTTGDTDIKLSSIGVRATRTYTHILSTMAQNKELRCYQELLSPDPKLKSNSKIHAAKAEIHSAPLVWWPVKTYMAQNNVGLKQYAVMGCEVAEKSHEELLEAINDDHEKQQQRQQQEQNPEPVLLNTNSPWSAFLCGSQGSGKSHALACMLEGCLMNDAKIGRNPEQLAGIVFHYDRSQGGDLCEAAYLCGKIPTKVLVSASHINPLRKRYEAIAKRCGAKITVETLELHVSHLDTARIKLLMAIGRRGEMPLYMNVSAFIAAHCDKH